MNNFNKLCTAMATLNDEQAERVVSYIETLGDGTDINVEALNEQDKWQHIIEEGYLCKFWDDNMYIPEYRQYGTLIEVHTDSRRPSFISFRHHGDSTYDNCEVLREKGIKQPYFQGDDIPDIIGEVVVYYGNTHTDYCRDVGDVDWSEVVAFIEV